MSLSGSGISPSSDVLQSNWGQVLKFLCSAWCQEFPWLTAHLPENVGLLAVKCGAVLSVKAWAIMNGFYLALYLLNIADLCKLGEVINVHGAGTDVMLNPVREGRMHLYRGFFFPFLNK